MPTAENAKLQYEAGQTSYAMAELTNSGDATTFTSAATLWSRRAGYAPVVRVNGLISGGAITPNATNNVVNVAALTCNLAGAVVSVGAGTLTASRGVSGDTHRITSLTVDSSNALAAVAGVDGTSFSATRGAAGGPPYIPVGSIEIGQVRLTSVTDAAVTAAEIFTVSGLHLERADDPIYTINYQGGSVTFLSALPASHTSDVPRKVYASYAAPIFGDIQLATDYVPVETTYSVTTQQMYGTTTASTSSSLGQGTFTAHLNNGITDPLVALKGQNLWFKFFPDRYQTPYQLTQGKLGISRTFGPSAAIQAACTISAESAGTEVG